MADLLIIETDNGGDLVLRNNDLVSIEGFENMPYLGMFGGNVAYPDFGKNDLNKSLSIGADLKVVDTENGGDLVLMGNDLVGVDNFDNMPYLAMFGGNPGGVTKPVPDGNQNLDWWGNFLMKDNVSQQFNSYTEESFRKNSLNVLGKALISSAISRDLKFLNNFGNISHSFEIVGPDRVNTFITLKIPTSNGKTIDWWANNLLMPKNPSIQFNSLTETGLQTINLTSGGRIILEQIITKDLSFMKVFASVKVTVKIISDDKVNIIVSLQQPTNKQNKDYQYLWEGTKAELLIASFNVPSDIGEFDFSFDLSFD